MLYRVEKRSENFRIFPKNKKNETIPLTIDRQFFILYHPCGDTVEFKKYLWRGRLLWGDSRQKGNVSEDFVVSELARMLFNGNLSESKEFIA